MSEALLELAALRERLWALCDEWYADRATGDFGAASRLCADEVRAVLASPLADTEQAEPASMRWNGTEIGPLTTDNGDNAEKIVAWVNANGGEARYYRVAPDSPELTPVIMIRTSNGWVPVLPGDEVVKGDWFPSLNALVTGSGERVREFTVRRAADQHQDDASQSACDACDGSCGVCPYVRRAADTDTDGAET